MRAGIECRPALYDATDIGRHVRALVRGMIGFDVATLQWEE